MRQATELVGRADQVAAGMGVPQYVPRYAVPYAHYAPPSAPKSVSYGQLAMGIGLLVVNVAALAALSCVSPVAGYARGPATYAYRWVVGIASTAIVVGAVALALNLFPPTKLLMAFFFGILQSLALLGVGVVATVFGAQTLHALEDPKCATNRTVALSVASGFALAGLAQAYLASR